MSFDAEIYLNSLEPIGWKLGLERMELLSDELGRPQDRFDSIHVVGTNGKSSVTTMTAALLAAHGKRTGFTVSPHLHRWSERVSIDGAEIDDGAFAAAVETTAAAADRVNERLGEGEVVTQFELATAAAFLALADAGVEVAVIEAGLGGRLDATNSIHSKVTVLTSIGLDHTEWLGETELEIAGEKLAVLRPGSTLVVGPVSDEVLALAEKTAADRDAGVIRVEPDRATVTGGAASEQGTPAMPMAAQGIFQRQNFEVAIAAAEALVGPLDQKVILSVAGSLIVPGRLEQVADDPPVFVDVAHNRPGAAALAASLPSVTGGRPVIACVGILADKDGPGMLAELGPSLTHLFVTELPPEVLAGRARPGARSFASADLLQVAIGGGIAAEAAASPSEALSRAKKLASDLNGVVLVAGSHYLVTAMDL